MEKYATYEIYKHAVTGEIKRIPYGSEELVKIAEETTEWIQLEEEPEDE